MQFSRDRIEEILRDRQPAPICGKKRAAVAAVLRFDDDGRAPDILLMRRAERDGDRWSGHVSFPGGREEEHDPSLHATAIRETHEEVGLDLESSGRFIGALDAVRAMARGVPLSTIIHPYVFECERDVDLVLGDEAVRAFWMPLQLAASGEIDSTRPYGIGPARLQLPCWRFDGEVVWGLTFQMLRSMIALLSEVPSRGSR